MLFSRSMKVRQYLLGFCLASTFLALMPVMASASTITVDTDKDQFNTAGSCSLRDAIQSANTNTASGGCVAGTAGVDTINLPNGNYVLTIQGVEDANTSGDLDVREALILNGTNITGTQIIGSGDRVIQSTNVPITINNLTIAGGNSTGQGGGAYFDGSASLLNVVFAGNGTTSSGGGAYFNGTANIVGSTFSGNTASFSGAGAVFNSTATISGTAFKGNVAQAGDGGGAFFGDQATATVMGSNFVGNNAFDKGGAMALLNTMATITTSTFVGNNAGLGGAVYFAAPVDSDNSQKVVNTLFYGNKATRSGGDVYTLRTNSLVIIHTTIASSEVNNQAALHVEAGTVYVTNTIITSHTVGIFSKNGTVTENYNLFFGNEANSSANIVDGDKSITGKDPMFTDLSTGNYHLLKDSPANGKGTPLGVLTDFDGDARSLTAPAIGYDENILAVVAKKIFLPLVVH